MPFPYDGIPVSKEGRVLDKSPSRPKSSRKKAKKIHYPESDGKPMAENTKQFRWIVKIKEGLEERFADAPDVFVAGDLLWYPVEGDNRLRMAPDAMVAFGRPKGDRGSYLQWKEENIPPQVVFEVLSPGNRAGEMRNKFKFYETYGVQEYYIYDPDRITFEGWIREGSRLVKIPHDEIVCWESPRLNLKFQLTDDELLIFHPDGQKFLTALEDKLLVRKERMRADKERMRADKERLRANKERLLADKERLRAEELQKREEAARERALMLEAKLKELGIAI
ncbi:MAG: Uma2 family endonuclease [Desulfamplus sp.]|nr:Uma2 family endonuclease [Desulfamplus sp.]